MLELTPGQRKAAFIVIVLALAGLGIFLLLPGKHEQQATGSTGPAASAPPPSPASSSPAAPTPPAASTGPARSVDIYRLLPFSQGSLSQAVALTERFGAAYGTYSYRENAAGYVATMRGLITSELAGTLARGFATPGVAQTRTQQKQASTGSAVVTGLRAFGPSSMTFLATVQQKITQAQGKSHLTSHYAVTVTQSGGRWQVSDVQLASAGNT
jgi:hypothetical protein